MNFYQILEVPQQADEEQIKQAYREKAKKYHPDLNPNNPEAEAKFKNIVEAYETLKDVGRRREYDLKLEKTTVHGHMAGRSDTKDRNRAFASHLDFEEFTKDMEKYFGFSFSTGTRPQGKDVEHGRENIGSNKKNPLDMTDMFEAYMRMK